MKEEKKFCPYCGSNKIMKSPGPMDTIDNGPALSIVVSIKSIVHKQYKCEDCGKEFN
jgi:DNA-directed RNA polymerase subunit RPC12/RpoP